MPSNLWNLRSKLDFTNIMKRIVYIYLFLLCSALQAQSFGQNKVQYRDFEWSFISSPNFDVCKLFAVKNEADLDLFPSAKTTNQPHRSFS